MNFQSMKFRLIALGAVLVILGLILRLAVGLPFAQEQLRDLVAAQQLSIASYIASDINQRVVERRSLISELAAVVPLSLVQRPDELAAWFKDRERLNPLFSGLRAIRPDGGVLAAYPALGGQSQHVFFGEKWFQAALVADAPVMSRPQRDPANGQPIIIMATPVRDADHRVVAVLAGVTALDGPGFLGRLKETRLGTTGGFLLISPADKLFVGSSDPSMMLTPTPPPGVNLLHDRAMAGYRGTGVTINAHGVKELSAMVSVPSTGWFVVARMPTTEAFQPIEVLRGMVVKGSFVALLVMLAALLLVMPRILRPLTETAHAMRQMADGKRELEPLPVQRADEIGGLVLGFNYLVGRLREKETALRANEASMEFLAHHDSLTGLYNRVILEDRLLQALARAGRNNSCFALLFFDLDYFKPINDDHGHNVGDAVLVQVATRLLEGRRRLDTVARLGGDEFVILMTDLVNIDEARAGAGSVARQCLAAICEPYIIDGKTFRLSASIGIALHSGLSVSSSQLMSQADIAMYRAKRAGKNGICFFEEEMAGISAAKSVSAVADV
ncbi:GGDEF domain-containing protein [Paralcaligenes sp. KSB-10]|uniref:GGDEF domain-containing protein n=1 Tax=Paralcaligenes sp. KSB-10 TaxID=2901142 RepID=UPI001E38140A|nr:GGDEF domain-containing protein [Paralcaligenes sp. KSB-10]UHL64154.1 GGDEF domain-containing protein [Paralcaligenes sp. KSB-10]